MASPELNQLARELEVAAAHFAMADQDRIHLSEADQSQSASVSEARVVSAAINALNTEAELPINELLVESANHPTFRGAERQQWKTFLSRVRSQLWAGRPVTGETVDSRSSFLAGELWSELPEPESTVARQATQELSTTAFGDEVGVARRSDPAVALGSGQHQPWLVRTAAAAVLVVAVVTGAAGLLLANGNRTSAGGERCDGGECTELSLAITPTTPPRLVGETSRGTTAHEGDEPAVEEPEAGGPTATSPLPAAEPSPEDTDDPGEVRATTPGGGAIEAPTTAPSSPATEPVTTTMWPTSTSTAPIVGGVACPGDGVATEKLDVARVAGDDVLNVRSGPAAGFIIVISLAPDATGIETYQSSTSGRWVLIAIPGAGMLQPSDGCGWVHSYYLASPGG